MDQPTSSHRSFEVRTRGEQPHEAVREHRWPEVEEHPGEAAVSAPLPERDVAAVISGEPEVDECQEVFEVDLARVEQDDPRNPNRPNRAQYTHTCICKERQASTAARQVCTFP